MRSMNNYDYELFERLVSLSQNNLMYTMASYLRKKYDKVVATKDYLVAVGDIPIALVAHMDTVFIRPVTNLYYDKRKGVLWSSEGLGADDRAGVFAILKILKSGLRPSVILTTDEEKGGVGACALSEIECPIPNLKYMIQLDRRGTNDCVFYDCNNLDFIQYVSTFGFCERIGSFSDISFLMPAWQVCGVNLSVGYENEHSLSETLQINALYDTIEKVKCMLTAENIPDFEYQEIEYYGSSNWWKRINHTLDVDDNADLGFRCCQCKNPFSEYEIFPVKGRDGNTKFYCPDCIVGNVDWCCVCGEAYEITDPGVEGLCQDCWGK